MKKNTSPNNEIAQTMAVAARILSVDLSVIKMAKRSGASCFLASGRVDIVELRKWLERNPPGGENDRDDVDIAPPEPVDLRTLEASLAAAVSVEETNLRMLRAAQRRNDAVAVAALNDAYSKSQKNRLLVERDVRKQKVEAGQLLTADSWKMELNRLYVPLLTVMRQIPRKGAEALAPDIDSIRVEKILSGIVEAAIVQAKGIVRPNTVAEQTWAASQLLVVISGPDRKINPKSLALVNSLREFVVTELAKPTNPSHAGQPPHL